VEDLENEGLLLLLGNPLPAAEASIVTATGLRIQPNEFYNRIQWNRITASWQVFDPN